MKKFYLLYSLFLLVVSCKKADRLKLCETGSVHSPFANRLGIESKIDASKISFEINGRPLSLNCPDLEDDYNFSILYMILPDNYYGTLHTFILKIRIPNYPSQDKLTYIYHNFNEFKGAGEYPLEHQLLPSGRENITELKIQNDTSKPYYYVQRRSYGWLKIEEFNESTYKIKGRFEMDFVNDNNYSDTIKVREGIFDGGFTLIR